MAERSLSTEYGGIHLTHEHDDLLLKISRYFTKIDQVIALAIQLFLGSSTGGAAFVAQLEKDCTPANKAFKVLDEWRTQYYAEKAYGGYLFDVLKMPGVNPVAAIECQSQLCSLNPACTGMGEAEAIRRRLQPYYGSNCLPGVFVDRLVQILQERKLVDSLESLLTATEILLEGLLEVWHFQGIDGFPLQLGSFALLHLGQPPTDLLKEQGSFCFCIGIQAFGTLSLKFSVNGKVFSSTVNKSDYTKIWSTDYYKRILKGRSGDFAGRLFTEAVLYDFDTCKYVYKSLKDVLRETFPTLYRSLSTPEHVCWVYFRRLSLSVGEGVFQYMYTSVIFQY